MPRVYFPPFESFRPDCPVCNKPVKIFEVYPANAFDGLYIHVVCHGDTHSANVAAEALRADERDALHTAVKEIREKLLACATVQVGSTRALVRLADDSVREEIDAELRERIMLKRWVKKAPWNF
jgi:hypothetical protein